MVLQRQTVSMPFAQGIDTETDPKHVPMGKLLDLRNGRFTKTGAIAKRYGHTDLGVSATHGGGTLSPEVSGGVLGERDGQLFAFGHGGLVAYSSASGATGWATDSGGDTSAIPSSTTLPFYGMKVKTNHVPSSKYGHVVPVTSVDCVTAGDITAVAWIDNGSLLITTMQASSGAVYMQSYELIASGLSPQKVRLSVFDDGTDAYILVVYVRDAVTPFTMECKAILCSEPWFINATYTIATDVVDAFKWDTAQRYCTDASGLLPGVTVVYEQPAGTIQWRLVNESASFDTASDAVAGGFATLSVDSAPNPAGGFVSVAAFTTTAGGDVDIIGRHDSLASTFAQTTAISGRAADYVVVGACGSYFCILGEVQDATVPTQSQTFSSSCTMAGAVVYANRRIGWGYGIASRPYLPPGGLLTNPDFVQVVLRAITNEQPHYIIVRNKTISSSVTGNFLCKFLYGYGPLLADYDYTSLSMNIASSTYGGYIALPTADLFVGSTTDLSYGVRIVSVDDDGNRAQLARFGESVVCSGGVPSAYDGCSGTELGFMLYPEGVTLTTAAVGGSLSDGAYSVRIVYSHYDSNNNRVQSAPSTAATITLASGGATQLITVAVPMLHHSYRENVRAEVYCTEAAGTTHYFISDIAASAAAATTSVNVTTVSTSNKVLYTSGGEYENIMPPQCASLVVRGDRLFMICEGDVWFSKKILDSSGAQLSDLLKIDNLSGVGDPRRLAEMDGRVVVFGSEGIAVIDGDGPNSLGQGSFSIPRKIMSEVVCLENSPIVSVPPGVFFVSSRGIELLSRDMSVSFIGADIGGMSPRNIVSACAVEDANEVRFGDDSSGGTSGYRVFVYNYRYGQWARHTGYQAESMVIYDGMPTILGRDGSGSYVVFKESRTQFDDDGTDYALLIDTPWIKAADVQGWQRVYEVAFVGDYKSGHVFTVDIYYDYSETSAQTVTKTITSDLNPQQFSIKPGKQKCQAIRFRIQDASPSGTKESFSISHMQLTIGVKGGVRRLPAAQTG